MKGRTAMRTVLEACVPRKSIIDGTFNPEIFTAALGPVIAYYHDQNHGQIDSIYTNAELFFKEATYPTDGLRKTVSSVFRRISGDANTPTIYRLDTAFGGGKTHTLIACVHIAYRGMELRDCTADILDSKYLPLPGTVTVVGIAGDELDVQKVEGDRLLPYTLWGEMAYQVGGEALYKEVRTEAESYAAPGKNFFEKVLGNKKVIIMLDELAQYASRLDAAQSINGGEQLSAFLMGLNNYAKSHTGIAIIVTLASNSDAFNRQTEALKKKLNAIAGKDAYTDDDALALQERNTNSLMSVVSRDATVVTPVQSTEIASVLAKRLFISINRTAANEVMKEYVDLYEKNKPLLPQEATNINFRKRLIENYPFHPKFIDFLNQKLALAEEFQGTRGVLRVLALTVRSIWQKQLPLHLIQVCDIDMRNSSIVDEILGRTGSSELRAVLTADVGSVETTNLAGGLSRAELEDKRNPHPDGIPMYEMTWKTVFLNSLVGRAKGKEFGAFGINEQDAILMVSSPILTPSQVKAALDKINESAFYLRYEDGKYFAQKDPTINSVLSAIRENVSGKEIDNKLKTMVNDLIRGDNCFTVEQNIHLPWHYEVSGPGEAHKLGMMETNVQEKNTCFTTNRKI